MPGRTVTGTAAPAERRQRRKAGIKPAFSLSFDFSGQSRDKEEDFSPSPRPSPVEGEGDRGRGSCQAASILQAQTFSSGILHTGSRAGFVSTLTGDSLKWKFMKIVPSGVRSVTVAFTSTAPRRELTLTL